MKGTGKSFLQFALMAGAVAVGYSVGKAVYAKVLGPAIEKV